MKLKIITLIGYTNIHTKEDVKKALGCADLHLEILVKADIIKIYPPHNIVILTSKGSNLYKVFTDILDFALS